MGKEQSQEFIRDQTEESINFLIQQDDSTKGTVTIDVNTDGTYDVTVHKGPELEVNKIRSVPKEKLLDMLESRL